MPFNAIWQITLVFLSCYFHFCEFIRISCTYSIFYEDMKVLLSYDILNLTFFFPSGVFLDKCFYIGDNMLSGRAILQTSRVDRKARTYCTYMWDFLVEDNVNYLLSKLFFNFYESRK